MNRIPKGIIMIFYKNALGDFTSYKSINQNLPYTESKPKLTTYPLLHLSYQKSPCLRLELERHSLITSEYPPQLY